MYLLPLPLLLLLQSQLIYAQTASSSLSLNHLFNFTASSVPKPPIFSLPAAHSYVSVTIALCASSPSPPRFFLSNSLAITSPGPSDVGHDNVFEIVLRDGFGYWYGMVDDGGSLSVSGTVQAPFEIGLSTDIPIHRILDDPALFGDSTSNQALIFSPPLPNANSTDVEDPSYPNYVLPPANISLPTGAPDLPIDVALFVAQTSSSSLASLPLTGCAMRAASFTNSHFVDNEQTNDAGLWLRDSTGWRWQWLVSGLDPSTNYTAYVVSNGTVVSGPSYFATKSGGFSCPIVHSLPYCPAVNYAVPITPPQFPASTYTSRNLPSNVTDQLLEGLTNFTITLTTSACGRDTYSALVSCADCQRAYRTWLCSIWFPRCSEASPSSNNEQHPMSALQPQSTSTPSRSPGLSPFTSDYNVLLPCLETCQAADRACPYFLGFKCPIPKFTASLSYGVGYIDTGEEGVKGGGITGMAHDRWGNVWCNGL